MWGSNYSKVNESPKNKNLPSQSLKKCFEGVSNSQNMMMQGLQISVCSVGSNYLPKLSQFVLIYAFLGSSIFCCEFDCCIFQQSAYLTYVNTRLYPVLEISFHPHYVKQWERAKKNITRLSVRLFCWPLAFMAILTDFLSQ